MSERQALRRYGTAKSRADDDRIIVCHSLLLWCRFGRRPRNEFRRECAGRDRWDEPAEKIQILVSQMRILHFGPIPSRMESPVRSRISATPEPHKARPRAVQQETGKESQKDDLRRGPFGPSEPQTLLLYGREVWSFSLILTATHQRNHPKLFLMTERPESWSERSKASSGDIEQVCRLIQFALVGDHAEIGIGQMFIKCLAVKLHIERSRLVGFRSLCTSSRQQNIRQRLERALRIRLSRWENPCHIKRSEHTQSAETAQP